MQLLPLYEYIHYSELSSAITQTNKSSNWPNRRSYPNKSVQYTLLCYRGRNASDVRMAALNRSHVVEHISRY